MHTFRHMDTPGFKPWPFVYFHGQAEELVKQNIPAGHSRDLVGGLFDLGSVEHETIESCTVYGHGAVLCLWRPKTGERLRGLIFLDGDTDARQYAVQKFRERSTFL